MTDAQWIAAVRKFVVEFGYYIFSLEERKKMLPYISDRNLIKALHVHRFISNVSFNLVLTLDFMNEMERGMVKAVTAKLTQ